MNFLHSILFYIGHFVCVCAYVCTATELCHRIWHRQAVSTVTAINGMR